MRAVRMHCILGRSKLNEPLGQRFLCLAIVFLFNIVQNALNVILLSHALSFDALQQIDPGVTPLFWRWVISTKTLSVSLVQNMSGFENGFLR